MNNGDRVKVKDESSDMVGELGRITLVREDSCDVLLDCHKKRVGRGVGKFELYFHKNELELLERSSNIN